MVTDNTRGDKVGKSSYTTIFGIPLGFHLETGVIAAAKNGGITKVATVDQTVYGGLFKSGLPVGKINNYKKENKNEINFFSDFRQLDYVKIVSYEMESKN